MNIPVPLGCSTRGVLKLGGKQNWDRFPTGPLRMRYIFAQGEHIVHSYNGIQLRLAQQQ